MTSTPRAKKRSLLRRIAPAVLLLLSPAVARADVVLDWNAIMIQTIAANPFATQRYTAITQLAVFEAVNAIVGDYEPYLGTITAPPGASAEAAAAAAAHAVLSTYFPAKALELDAALATSLAAIPDGPGKDDGISVGRAAAAAMIALRANDGATPPAFRPAGPAEPGRWQSTPSCPAAGATNLQWATLTPFGVPDVRAFRAEPPPRLTSDRYRRDYLEVKTVGAVDSVRPQDRTDVARMYAAGLSPAGWANWTARQVAFAQGRSLSENARGLALLNMALNDASVAVFDSKFLYDFWRPETAIHGAATDGNTRTEPDSAFVPFITAPCFASYPSNHGTASGAAAFILERLYGKSHHDISLSAPSVPGVMLHYSSFRDIVQDVDDARVYGGIHFRFDQEAGGKQGRAIAEYIYENRLRPVRSDRR